MMKRYRILLTSCFGLLLSGCTFFNPLSLPQPIVNPSCPRWELCFTPGEACTSLIQTQIQKAKHSLLIQAYGFTSAPIGDALVAAKKRGVSIQIILDKSNKSAPYSLAPLMLRHHIPIWIDTKPAIAHNKIMIIDSHTVITGSFNFSQGAQDKNAENLLVIQDASMAKRYTENWKSRLAKSTPLTSAVSNKIIKPRRASK